MECMVGGMGDHSYAHNSGQQAAMFRAIQPALHRFLLANADCCAGIVRIADLGCSSGPNTLHAIRFVVDVLSSAMAEAPPSFHVFFSDLPTNDFNTLFSLLPHHAQGRPYFFAAVPGSFYHKLFPSSSLHVAMSNVALHWLSEIPRSVVNRGRIWVDSFSEPQVLQAFQDQADADLCSFLTQRAEELVQGGLLSLLMVGREEQQKCKLEEQIEWARGYQSAWESLVEEGVVEQRALDSFNLPVFFRTTADVRRAVERGGAFGICQLWCTKCTLPSYDKAWADLEARQQYARDMTMAFTSVCKGAVCSQLGDEQLADKLFDRMQAFLPALSQDLDLVVAFLKRL